MFRALAEKLSGSVGIIGGADGPTEIIVAEAAKGTVDGLKFTTENISEALLCSVAGMVGIFIVIGIIILSVSILNKSSNKKDK